MSGGHLGAAIVCALGLWLFVRRLRDALRPCEPEEARAGQGRAPAPVSIIVPARNEGENLPALLASLARLRPRPLEVLVVDDHSTDDTARLARAAGARVIAAPPVPEGWLGKPWACRAGAAAARGDYLLFTDADTVHAPDSLARALALSRRDRAGLVSVIPTHAIRAAWEKLQGVFHLLLLVATRAAGSGPGAKERRFSIGQYLLFRRDAYDQIGGHEPARARVAEDLLLARRVAEAGLPVRALCAPGLLSVRMYPEGLAAFFRGWRRNFREGIASAGAAGVAETSLVIGYLLGLPLWAAQAALGAELAWLAGWVALYGLTAVQVARSQRQLGDFPTWSAILYPVFVLFFVAISAAALYDRARGAPVRWRAREVALDRLQ